MIGTELGPYRLVGELGSGGMGRVYLAEGEEGQVALKVLHPHLLERAGFYKRFQREAEVGRRVRHPNVVRTLDCDLLLAGGQPCFFLVMEYVEGSTLRDLLRDLGRVPEALLREIARQAVDGLVAIHAEGVVHRDLKPENVLITDDRVVRIMDLGIAKLSDVSVALTGEGQFAGSLLYASPEQMGRGEIDAATDLYSLGVVLHELASGENPFRRAEAAAVIHAHLHHEPPRLDALTSECSPFFAEVVTTLLAKDPARRFASAAELRDVLSQGERSDWWGERSVRLRRSGRKLPSIQVRRETTLYGRDTEVDALGVAWDRARFGGGATVLLEGEAGIGKTRLVDEFLRSLEDEDVHVLYGSYPPAGGMGGLSDAVVERFGDAHLANALGPYLTVTPSLVPAFAALVRHEGPPEGAAPLEGDALHAVFCHLVHALAAEKPTLWIVDDLHFASAESRAVVLSLARAIPGHRVLLLLTTRPGVPDEEIAHFARLETFRRVSPGRLGAREVVQLLRDAFHSDALADKLGAKIAYKSDGVPFFVFEMIRGLEEGQFIERLPDGSYIETKVVEEIEVPSAVRDLIEARLRDLPDERRAILDVAAVQGFAFDPDLVARVLERKRIHVLQDLAALERRSGVVRGHRGECRFDHHQIQEVIYRDLMPDLRVEYHALLAEALERRESAIERDPEELDGSIVTELCRHYLHGDRGQRARRYLRLAIAHLQSVASPQRALELADDALRSSGLLAGEQRVDVLLQKVALLDLAGGLDRQRGSIDEALQLAESVDDKERSMRALRALGNHLYLTSHYEEAKEVLYRAVERAREAGDRGFEGHAAGAVGNVLYRQGLYDESQTCFERQIALCREAGDLWGEALGANSLGNLVSSRGDLEGAEKHYERHLAISREIGNQRGEAMAVANLGILYWQRGLLKESREHHERSLAILGELGDRRLTAAATGSLGLALLAEGRVAEAQRHFERHLHLAREIGDVWGEAIASYNLASQWAICGRPDQCFECLETTLAIVTETGFRLLHAAALMTLAEWVADQGRGEEAELRSDEAVSILRELGDLSILPDALVSRATLQRGVEHTEDARASLEEAVHLATEADSPGAIVLAQCHLARLPDGDVELAAKALREYESRLEKRKSMEAHFILWCASSDAAHLGEAHRALGFLRDHAPEDCRDTMIENVPLHRDIVAAWREHGGSESETAVGT